MNYASMIDHTVLKPNAASTDIIKLCKEAAHHHFASVCINPCWVPLAYEQLKETDVAVCTVIGFPLGATTTMAKVCEAVEAVKNGANEVDMVINIGRLLEGDYDFVRKDISAVTEAVKGHAIVKVILETCLLQDEQIVKACELCVEANADFVKTSTGFSTGGATEQAVALMKRTVGDHARVKASGGVRTREDAKKMVEAGADRIGTSNGTVIVSAE